MHLQRCPHDDEEFTVSSILPNRKVKGRVISSVVHYIPKWQTLQIFLEEPHQRRRYLQVRVVKSKQLCMPHPCLVYAPPPCVFYSVPGLTRPLYGPPSSWGGLAQSGSVHITSSPRKTHSVCMCVRAYMYVCVCVCVCGTTSEVTNVLN